MKKLNFKWLVVLYMAMGFATVAKAQIYSSEACFYVEAGSSKIEYVVKFESNGVWLCNDVVSVKSNLAKSKNYYDDMVWKEAIYASYWTVMYDYDFRKSTSSREVYKRKDTRAGNTIIDWFGNMPVYNSIHGYRYVAFSKDKSSFIMWFEDDNSYDGEIKNRHDYSRIPKEDLLPKAVNHDFLND